MQFFKRLDSPLGRIILASDGENLTGLWFEGQKHCGSTLNADAREIETLPLFSRTEGWLDDYFAGKTPSPRALPLSLQGTPFRRMIWEMLCEIPYGGTTTYGELARLAAQKMHRSSMSAQAIGNAVGRNPVSIIIPCHRVVGSGGELTGYAGGIERKAWLLKHERGTKCGK